MKYTQEQNIESIKNFLKVYTYEEVEDLKIIRYEMVKGKPAVKVWKGKQKDPFMNYYYRSEEQREAGIQRAIESSKRVAEYKANQRAIRKSYVPQINEGDIYRASWGYDQTNIDYYQIVGKVGTHYAMVCKIGQEFVRASGPMSEYVKPVKNAFTGKLMKKKVTGCNGSQAIRIDDVRTALTWNGTEDYQSHYH